MAVALAAIGITSILLTAATADAKGAGQFAITAFMMLLGPVSGWILMWYGAQVAAALGLLLATTLVCAVPVAYYIRRGNVVWLGVASLLWATAGFLFTVAIWI